MKKYFCLLMVFLVYYSPGFAQNLSQTRTASIFNWNGNNPYYNLWSREGAQYVAADDDSYAYSKKITPKNSALLLVLQDFHFNIPQDASIVNINVIARRFKKGKADIRDYFATLIKAGTNSFNPVNYGVRWMNTDNYPQIEAPVTYSQAGSGNNGGSGNSVYQWTPALINAQAFGVEIQTFTPTNGSLTVYYDQVQITVEYSLPVTAPREAPAATEIKPVKAPVIYPNPFTTKTNLQFTAAESGNTVVELYNIAGIKMRTLFSGNMIQGQVTNIEVGDAGLAKGVYIYVIRNDKQKFSGRITKLE